jgi:LysR family transcriptional regulator, transcriptional activator of nhaA
MIQGMDWLNYHHLLYFWVVAREGSVRRACELLDLAQPTVSGQLRALEKALKVKLFERSGRNLVLTDAGRLAYRYADEIFSLGKELQSVLRGQGGGRPLRLVVGAADALPKLIVHRLLEPALHLSEPVQIICREGSPDRLLAELALHELDLVFSDEPANPALRMRVFNHLLGECGVSFFGTARYVKALRSGFPRSLSGADMLLPTTNTALRRALDQWFETEAIQPRLAAEFADNALLNVFGQAGHGVFAGPTALEADLQRQYDVGVVGRTNAIRKRFYAISVERRLKSPAVVAICESARQELFSEL